MARFGGPAFNPLPHFPPIHPFFFPHAAWLGIQSLLSQFQNLRPMKQIHLWSDRATAPINQNPDTGIAVPREKADLMRGEFCCFSGDRLEFDQVENAFVIAHKEVGYTERGPRFKPGELILRQLL